MRNTVDEIVELVEKIESVVQSRNVIIHNAISEKEFDIAKSIAENICKKERCMVIGVLSSERGGRKYMLYELDEKSYEGLVESIRKGNVLNVIGYIKNIGKYAELESTLYLIVNDKIYTIKIGNLDKVYVTYEYSSRDKKLKVVIFKKEKVEKYEIEDEM